MTMTNPNLTAGEAIKDAMRFAHQLGVPGLTAVVLTDAMLQEVCADAGIAFAPKNGRLYIGNYLFVLCENTDKALVLRPEDIEAVLTELTAKGTA